MSKDRKRVKAFVERWKDGGEEDSQCQKFLENLMEVAKCLEVNVNELLRM